MKKTSGYIIALSIGVFLGWLAQQFWSVVDNDALPSIIEISNNEMRLKKLQADESNQQAFAQVVNKEPEAELTTLTQYLQSRDYDLLERALGAFSQIDSRHYPFIRALGNYMIREEQFLRSLDVLYDLRLNVLQEDSESYRRLIEEYVELVEKTLEKKGDTDQIVKVYEALVILEADYTPYYLKLANWLILRGDLLEAEAVLNNTRHDLGYEREVLALEAVIQDAERRKELIIVPLKPVGDHYLATVRLNEYNDVSLMLDTGATKTVIKESIVLQNWPGLIDSADELILNTANGTVSGRTMKFDTLEIGSTQLTEIELSSLPLADFDYDGLLGMDVLKRFEFKLDQVIDVLLLRYL